MLCDCPTWRACASLTSHQTIVLERHCVHTVMLDVHRMSQESVCHVIGVVWGEMNRLF